MHLIKAALEEGAEGLSSPTLAELEASLDADPENLRARALLLGHYGMLREARLILPHLLDLIRACPGLDDLASFLVKARRNPAEYATVANAWLEVANTSQDSRALCNSFRFVGAERFDDARSILQRAEAMGLTSTYEWTCAAAVFFLRHGRRRADIQLLRRATWNCHEALRMAPSPYRRAGLLPTAVVAFYAAGLHEDAEQLAKEMVAAHRDGFNSAALRHWGHGTLGLVALERGDLKAASLHLAASVPPEAGFFMDTFGPYLDLAARLHHIGSVDDVRHYLVQLGKVWTKGHNDVERWVAQIDSGREADFMRADGTVAVPWNDG